MPLIQGTNSLFDLRHIVFSNLYMIISDVQDPNQLQRLKVLPKLIYESKMLTIETLIASFDGHLVESLSNSDHQLREYDCL